MPSTPCSTACRASSGWRMPLSRIGSLVSSRSRGDVGPGQRRPRVDRQEPCAPRRRGMPERRFARKPAGVGRALSRISERTAAGVGRPDRVHRLRLERCAVEHGVARVLRDPLAEREREVREVEVARPPAEHRRVERDDDGVAAAGLRAPDEARDELVRGAPVELEPARPVAHRGGDLLHRPRRLVREDQRHALGRGRLADGDVGVPVRELEDADRREEERRGSLRPRSVTRHVPLGDVPQDARDDPPPLECGSVGGDRRLAPGPAGDVRVCLARHPAPGGLLQLLGVERDRAALPRSPAR